MGTSPYGVGLASRLWNRVTKGSGCWLWQGCTDSQMGYGMIWDKNTMRLTHRVAWELKNGKIPDGLNVLHTCDVPSCVRPEHLFLGTHQDNMADMKAKGRGKTLHGIDNNKAKLTENEVRHIRIMRLNGSTLKKIASYYRLSIANIHDVVERHIWRHVR